MSIFDFLKKEKKGEEKVEQKQEAEEVKKEKIAEEKSAEPVRIEEAEKPKKTEKAEKTEKRAPAEKEKKTILGKKRIGKEIGIGYKVLKVPHISEKATDLLEKNQYVFNVSLGANKQEIKQAVKEIYGVDVVWVNVINIPRRKRRVGRTMGWKQGYRKAIVKIKEGQKIELLPR